jgi:hypothetical protein
MKINRRSNMAPFPLPRFMHWDVRESTGFFSAAGIPPCIRGEQYDAVTISR